MLLVRAFGGSRVKARRLYLEETCVVYFIERPSVMSRDKTRRCILPRKLVFYLIERPSVGPGLRLEDVYSGKFK